MSRNHEALVQEIEAAGFTPAQAEAMAADIEEAQALEWLVAEGQAALLGLRLED